MTRAQGLRVLAMAGLLAGCVSGGDEAEGDDGDGNGNRPRTPGQFMAANAMARLTRADSCEDLLAHIQNDISAKIELRAETMRDADAAQNAGGGAIGRGPIATPGMAGPSFPAGNPAPPSGDFGAPSMGGAAGTGGSAMAPVPSPMTPENNGGEPTGTPDLGAGTSNLGPTDHSNTNVQVEGIDEADIVKTDGSHIYLLHGNELFVLDSWPADAMAVAGRIDVEGRAVEMFVNDGVAAVFSLVYDQGDLIEQPKTAADGTSFGPAYYYGSPFTKITLIDVNGAQPVVQRQLLIEGNYLSSRLHGTTVRAVIQGGFRNPPLYSAYIEYQDPWGRQYSQQEIDLQVDAWRDRMTAAVEQTTLSDWLPIEREIEGGQLTEPERRCTDFYAPSPGLTEYGLTNIVSFDIQDPESELGGAIVLGSADEVYSNESVLLLAHRDWRWDQGLIERERTVLHQFALDGASTAYTASGFVPGHIVDQFSIDERAGIVRIASSIRLAQNFVAPVPAIASAAAEQDDANGVFVLSRRTTDNRVIALKADGDALEAIGASEPLGHDGETIFSTRFIGDRGYVVTFRQRDPLIVLDLADPEQPTVLGEAVIPGFSDYMHPLDDDHLVTIGRDVDAQTGQDLGLMLQIFDVSDAANPRRTHGYRFGENGYSEANVNHKAFTFHRPEGASSALLAFPYVNHAYPGFSSSLEVFAVSADAGFDKLGAIDHTGLIQNLCGSYMDPAFATPVIYQCVQSEVRRGLFIFGNDGDFVYSISNAGVLAHDMADLAAAVATVSLPMPDYSENRTYFGPTGGAVMNGTVPPSSAQPPVMTTPPPAMGTAGAGGI